MTKIILLYVLVAIVVRLGINSMAKMSSSEAIQLTKIVICVTISLSVAMFTSIKMEYL